MTTLMTNAMLDIAQRNGLHFNVSNFKYGFNVIYIIMQADSFGYQIFQLC
jgi:hypothetical protein